MRFRTPRNAITRAFCAEALEPRTLFSGPPITSAPQAEADVSGVRALLTDPTRGNIVYLLTDRRVMAIDTSLGRTVDWGNIQANGLSIAVSPAGDRLYVSEPSAFAIEVLSLPDLSPVKTLHLGVAPGSIAAGVNNQVYVATYGGQSQQLVQVDAVTGASATRVGLWGSNELRATPDGMRIFYTMIEGGSGGGLNVDEYDVTGPSPVHVNAYPIDYANSQDFEVDTVHGRVFTANGGVYGVGLTVMDSKFKSVWSFGGPAYATAVTLSPDRNTVYGSSGWTGDAVIQAFDIATGNRTANYATAPYAVQKGLLAATANGRILYVGGDSSSGAQRLFLIGGTTLVVDDVPTARATATVTAGHGSATVSFDGTASSAYGLGQALTSYAWDFGDGQTGAGPTAQHTYAAPGTYSVVLTVTGSTGLADDVVLPVTLGVTANSNGPYSVLVDRTIPLSAAGSHSDFGDIGTYEWDTDYDGITFTPDLTGASPTFSAIGLAGNTTRTLALRVTDAAGNVRLTTTSLVINAVTVTASHGGAYVIVAGTSVTLNGSNSASNFGPITTYEWDIDYDGTTFSADLSGAAPTFDAAALTANTGRLIALRVTDSGGHVGISTTRLYVVAPTVVADPGGPYQTLAGGTVTLSGPGSSSNFGPIVSYEWDTDYHDGTFTPRASGSTVNFSTAGIPGNVTRTVALRVTDSGGNTTIATTLLSINPVTIFARFLGPNFVYPGDPVQLQDYGSGSNLGPIATYDWDTAYDGTTFAARATGANPVLSSAGWARGNHSVALRVTDVGGNQAYATLNIFVLNVPGDGGGGTPLPGQAVDATPPAASLSSVPAPVTGGAAARFTVTYSDSSGIDVSSLDGNDILVRGPHGFSQLARFVSAVPTDGTHQTVTATYEIPAPAGGWDGAANGTYTLLLNAGQVTDEGTPLAASAGILGAFAVSLTPPDAPDLRVAFTAAPPAKLTAGDSFRVPLRLTNVGTRNLSTSKVSVRLFASADPILDDGDLSAGVLTKQISLKKGASQVWMFAGSAPKVPATGKYFLLAQVDSGYSVKERNEDNNVASASTRMVARVPDLAVEFSVKGTRYAPGQFVAASFRLTNTGNDVAKGLLPVRVYARLGSQPDPTNDLLVLDTSFKINLRAGARQVLPAFFPAPASLTGRSGYFYVVIGGSAVGDTNAANDRAVAFTKITIV